MLSMNSCKTLYDLVSPNRPAKTYFAWYRLRFKQAKITKMKTVKDILISGGLYFIELIKYTFIGWALKTRYTLVSIELIIWIYNN